MTTTPTPVERAAEAIEDNTGLNGIIDGEAVALAALDAALDVDEIARVLYLHRCSIGDYVDGVTAWRDLPESWQDEWRDAARAVIAHLTGATR